jgi:hypothetical protein
VSVATNARHNLYRLATLSFSHALLFAPPSFLIVCYATDWDRVHLAVNTVVVVWLFVAKLPELDGVRFFNINRGPLSATKE